MSNVDEHRDFWSPIWWISGNDMTFLPDYNGYGGDEKDKTDDNNCHSDPLCGAVPRPIDVAAGQGGPLSRCLSQLQHEEVIVKDFPNTLEGWPNQDVQIVFSVHNLH